MSLGLVLGAFLGFSVDLATPVPVVLKEEEGLMDSELGIRAEVEAEEG